MWKILWLELPYWARWQNIISFQRFKRLLKTFFVRVLRSQRIVTNCMLKLCPVSLLTYLRWNQSSLRGHNFQRPKFFIFFYFYARLLSSVVGLSLMMTKKFRWCSLFAIQREDFTSPYCYTCPLLLPALRKCHVEDQCVSRGGGDSVTEVCPHRSQLKLAILAQTAPHATSTTKLHIRWYD